MNFFFYQNESELPEDIINGNCYFVSNSSSSKGFDIYLDDEGSRKIFDESIVGLTYNQFMEAIKDLIFSTININAPSNISISPTAYVLNEQEKETNSFPVRALGNYTGYVVYGNQGKSASATIEITKTGQTLTLSPSAVEVTVSTNMSTSSIVTFTAPSGKQIQGQASNKFVLWENGSWKASIGSNSASFTVTLGKNTTVTINEEEPEPTSDYYIGFITDSHQSTAGLNYLESHNPDIIIHGGDYIEYGAPGVLDDCVRDFGRHIACMGNHDYTMNSAYTQYASDSETASCFSGTMMSNTRDKYYYYDLTSAKIRLIILNTQDRAASSSDEDPQHCHNISNAQLSFLRSALSGRDSSWRAIIVSHAPLTPLNDRDGWYGSTVGAGMTNARSALSGYSVAEAGDKMPVLIALSGHCHALGYKYYDGICHFTGYSNNSSKNTYGGVSGDGGTSGERRSHYYLLKITNDNKVTVYDYVNNSIFKTIEIDGTESGGGGGNPDSDSTFSCIAFENGKLQYLDRTRTAWNDNNRNGNLDQVLYPYCDKTTIKLDSGQPTTYTFVNGLMQNGVTRMPMTPPDGISATYAAYFNSSGEYIGYSNASSQSKTNNPSSPWWDDNGTGNGDFFGVPEQKLSDALGS